MEHTFSSKQIVSKITRKYESLLDLTFLKVYPAKFYERWAITGCREPLVWVSPHICCGLVVSEISVDQKPHFNELRIKHRTVCEIDQTFFSQNPDLIEHKLYKWPGERYRLRWAYSFQSNFLFISTYFPLFKMFLSITIHFYGNSSSHILSSYSYFKTWSYW
jgi:hypothetical protein